MDNSATPDLAAMSREELEKLLKKQQELIEEQKQTIKEREDAAAKDKIKFHKKITKIKTDLAAEKSQNKKLNEANSNLTVIYENLIVYIRENRLNSIKIFRDENIPSKHEYARLNDFLTSIASSLIYTVMALHEAQQTALNLGKSEKNKGEEASVTDDIELEKYGKEENAREAEIREGLEQEDIVYDSDEDSTPPPADTSPDNSNSITSEDTEGKVKIYAPDKYAKALADNDSLYRCLHTPDEKDILDKLKNGTEALQSLHDSDYQNEGVVKRRPETHYVSATDSNEVAGILTYGQKKSVYIYCPKCGKVEEFTINSKADRVNTLYTLTNGNRDVKNTLVPVYTVCCTECGYSTQLNPAASQDLTVVEDVDSIKGEGKLFLTEGTSVPYDRNGKEQSSDTQTAGKEHSSGTQTTGKETNDSAYMSHSDTSASVQADGIEHTSDTQTAGKEHASGKQAAGKEIQNYRADDALRQKERRKIYREIKNNANNISMSCGNYNLIPDTDIIDPWSFSANANAYAMTPAFVKSKLSVGLLTVMGATFCQLGVAKNKIKTVFDGAGLPIGRDQLTGGINCFARAFLHKIAEKIKKDILNTSETFLMDESVLLVMETAKKKKSQGSSRKSEIWVMNSGWTSDINASYFYVSPTRAGQTAIELLKDVESHEKKYLVADGYSGYDTAVRKLNKDYGKNIVLARCHTHCRRPLHKYLNEAGLLKIYNKYLLPKGAKFTDFYDNLKKYRARKNVRTITERETGLLIIYYLINALFVVDSAVAVKHGYNTTSKEFMDDLHKERQNRSAKILDALFDAIKIFIAKNPLVMKASVNNKGQICYTPNKIFTESKALLYFIRYEQDLRRFIESPTIELTQSSCERSIKDLISVRRNSQKLQSEDGAAALADFMTIAHTCALNHVSVQQYILWVVANIKHQLYEMKLAGHEDPTFFCMPRRQEMFDENKEMIKIGIYDKRNVTCYDKVNVTGLTPYEYKKFLDEGVQRSK